jgi:hypothetical protein
MDPAAISREVSTSMIGHGPPNGPSDDSDHTFLAPPLKIKVARSPLVGSFTVPPLHERHIAATEDLHHRSRQVLELPLRPRAIDPDAIQHAMPNLAGDRQRAQPPQPNRVALTPQHS